MLPALADNPQVSRRVLQKQSSCVSGRRAFKSPQKSTNPFSETQPPSECISIPSINSSETCLAVFYRDFTRGCPYRLINIVTNYSWEEFRSQLFNTQFRLILRIYLAPSISNSCKSSRIHITLIHTNEYNLNRHTYSQR